MASLGEEKVNRMNKAPCTQLPQQSLEPNVIQVAPKVVLPPKSAEVRSHLGIFFNSFPKTQNAMFNINCTMNRAVQTNSYMSTYANTQSSEFWIYKSNPTPFFFNALKVLEYPLFLSFLTPQSYYSCPLSTSHLVQIQ